MSILVTTTVTRMTPLRTVAHKVRGVRYDRAVPPEVSVTSEDSDPFPLDRESILARVSGEIKRRRLPYDPGSASESVTLGTGFARARRTWSVYGTGDRYVVEVAAERRPVRVDRPVRPVTPRAIGPIAERPRPRPGLAHEVRPVPGGMRCSCGDVFPYNRYPKSHRRQLQAAGFFDVTRTLAPIYY